MNDFEDDYEDDYAKMVHCACGEELYADECEWGYSMTSENFGGSPKGYYYPICQECL